MFVARFVQFLKIHTLQVRNNISLFVNCLVENPTFDSQSKETLTLSTRKFGSVCNLSDKFYKKCHDVGIVDAIVNSVLAKNEVRVACIRKHMNRSNCARNHAAQP
jgi:DNA topoisomerase-2